MKKINSLFCACLLSGCASTPALQPVETFIVTEEPEYVLPSENVLRYKQYSFEQLSSQARPQEEDIPGVTPSSLMGHGNDSDLNTLVVQKPAYPKAAFAKKLEGQAIAEFTVSKDNRMEQIKIISSVPNDSFGTQMRKALDGWRYSTVRAGKIKYTVTHVQVMVTFKIINKQPMFIITEVDGTDGNYPRGFTPTKLSED